MSALVAPLALGFAVLAWAAHATWAVRRRGLSRRVIPLALAIIGFVPALLVLLEWAHVVSLPFVRFERPLLTLPAALALTWLAVRLLRLSSRASSPRRALIEAFASASALAASLCAAGLELGRPLDRLTLIVAIDRSRSIDLVPGADTRVANELRVAELAMREDDRIATVAFGATAKVEEPARPRSRLPSPQRAEVPRDGTDIAAAIRQALAEIPPDSAARIAIISDGVATRGDTLDAALSATALSIPIDVIALDQGSVTDVRIIGVHVAPRAAEGEPLELRVVTQSTSEARITLRVYRDGTLIRQGPARISAGEDVIYLREVAPGPGLHCYDVELSADDPALDRSPDDNAGSGFVRVRGQSTALVLESSPELGQAMAAALRSSAFEVELGSAATFPADLAGLARYDLIVLGDVSAVELASGQLDAVRSYVRDLGGGLLLLGGDHAMGPGGYSRTPVEDVSPVSFDLKQERRRASLAEVIAVDYSGSMAMSAGSSTKLELANEAAARSADLLGAGDRLGVMHVDTAVSWTVPLAPVVDKADIAARIRKVGPGGGGIFVDLTLSAAYQSLARENVQLKHLLLFADGSDAEERSNAFSLVNQAKKRGMTTSVVALGNGSDVPALSRMAELGGGRFYLIEDATRLPAVFAQETILASRSAINEQTFVPDVRTPHPVLRGIDFASAPPLTGYVVTIPKGRSQVLLSGPEGDPLLATWSVGIGRSGAFTSDYKDRWGRAWTAWDGAARLFAQLGRDLARRVDDPHVRWEADTAGGQLELRATLVDDKGRHDALRRLRARVGGPDGFTREVPLEPKGAGSYEAKVALSRPGAYLAALIDSETAQPLSMTGAALSAGEESRPTGTDRALLRQIATLTGGKVRDTLAGVFRERTERRRAYAPLAPELSIFAALSCLAMVACRRLSWPSRSERSSRRAGHPITERESADSRVSPASEPKATFQALRRAKARSGSSRRGTPETVEPLSSDVAPLRPPPTPIAPEHVEAASEPQAPNTPDRSAAPPPKPAAPPAGAAPRGKSAAEILLERRRARSPK